MEFFKEAMEFLPDNWRSEDYSHKTYVLVDLEKDSEEYKEMQQYCDENGKKNVTEIKRIQHPFAYLRFRLRCELHNISRWGHNREMVRVQADSVDAYIQYNCDDRRQQYGSLSSSDTYVIKKYINHYSFPKRDVNWYPEYVITTAPTVSAAATPVAALLSSLQL